MLNSYVGWKYVIDRKDFPQQSSDGVFGGRVTNFWTENLVQILNTMWQPTTESVWRLTWKFHILEKISYFSSLVKAAVVTE